MTSVIYLTVEDILKIYRHSMFKFGGEAGILDNKLLESAVAMPQSTYDGIELHIGISEKAAAYHYHLCSNHPFIDGNKRIALAAAEVFLLLNGYELDASDNEVLNLTLGVANGELSKAQVIAFFKQHVIDRNTD